jgi:sulfatase maturation enzyme AslB (radical SAM superfamily)
MQFLIDKDLAKNITIEYTTNCTLTPTQEWIDRIKLFKKVIVICSIDGVGAVNDKIRTGSKWSKIAETFDFYKTLDIELNVNTVVMTENIFHLLELSEWVNANGVNIWSCNVLTWPTELSIRTLPNADKQQLYPIIANSNITDKQFILEQLK